VLDGVEEAAHRRGDHRPSVGHGLAGDDPVALPPGGTANHRRPLVVGAERPRRNEADRIGHEPPQRPVADDDPRQPLGRGGELLDPLLRGEPAHVEDVCGLGRLSDALGDGDAASDHPHLACTEAACVLGQSPRGAENETGPAQHGAGEPGGPARELDIRPPELDDVRPARERSHEARGKPVGVDEVGGSGRPAGSSRVGGKEGGKKRRPRRAPAQVADDAVTVGEAEVGERRRRDDLHLHPGRLHVLDRIPDEDAGDIVLEAGERGG